MRLIGVGNTGCKIVKKISSYIADCKSYYFNSEIIQTDSYFRLIREEVPENYERNFPKLKAFEDFESREDVLLVMSSSGHISSCSLVLLEQIAQCNIRIALITPDVSLLDKKHRYQHNAISKILQEYSRSGLFREVLIFSNTETEKICKDISFSNYYETINENIASALFSLIYFENQSPVFGQIYSPEIVSRISSLGLKDIRNAEERNFFSVQNPRDVIYYFGLNEEDIESKEVRQEILKQMREKKNIDTKLNISFGIFPIKTETSYCYIITRTNVIQDI